MRRPKAPPTPPEPHIPELPIRTIPDMGLKELERIRLILRGGSVIEWRRMHFKSRDEVDRFLRLCLIDPDDPVDQRWARAVLSQAVEYLRSTFNYRVADAVANPFEIHDLFLYAAQLKEPKRYQKIACIVLKVMHVIQHVEGRDLLFRLAVSEAELAEIISRKVTGVLREATERGLPIVEFQNSIKTRDAVITKLLAKKDTIAAQIYDKTRFRIVTKTAADIPVVLYHLTQRLFPFNFVVPDQTQNTLINFKAMLSEYPHFQTYAEQLHLDVDYESREKRDRNRFSGSSYRVLNFIADIPIRLDAYLPTPEQDDRPRKNRIGFALVEFQLVDVEAATLNEAGENSHDRYKARQKRRVLQRLSRGLVVPKRRPPKGKGQ